MLRRGLNELRLVLFVLLLTVCQIFHATAARDKNSITLM